MKRVSRFLAISATAIILPLSSQAGFEWVAPEKVQEPVYQAPQQPVIQKPMMQEPVMAPKMIEPMQAEDLIPPSAAVPQMAAVPPEPVVREGLFDVHDGFGTDIPLVIAVRQIVPEDYTYAFDIDVNMSERVSWDGGEPWIDVLDKTLADQGMKADLNGNAIRISLIPASQAMKTTHSHKPMTLKHVSMQPAQNAEVEMHHETKSVVKTDKPVIEPIKDHEMMAPVSETEAEVEEVAAAEETQKQDKLAMFKKAEPVKAEEAAEESMQEPVDLQRRAKPMYSDHQPVVAEEPIHNANATPETVVKPVPIALPQHDVTPASSHADQFVKYDDSKVHYWSAAQGADVKSLLMSWSKKVGVTLYWGARSDYQLKMPIELHGTYTQAVQAVLGSYGEQTPRPWGRFHPNLADGKSILIVQNFPDY